MMRFILLHGKYKKEGKERKQHRSLARKSSAKVFNAKLIINLNVQKPSMHRSTVFYDLAASFNFSNVIYFQQ